MDSHSFGQELKTIKLIPLIPFKSETNKCDMYYAVNRWNKKRVISTGYLVITIIVCITEKL